VTVEDGAIATTMQQTNRRAGQGSSNHGISLV
jgi:hypothetical protein